MLSLEDSFGSKLATFTVVNFIANVSAAKVPCFAAAISCINSSIVSARRHHGVSVGAGNLLVSQANKIWKQIIGPCSAPFTPHG